MSKRRAGHFSFLDFPVIKLFLLPLLFYFSFFVLFTYPAIIHFSTHFFTDAGDGLQNIWNIWWVNESMTSLHKFPWFTTYLFYPGGTSLLGHTLSPMNGFLAVPLLKFLSLIQTYNIIVIFSFVSTGLTTFYLSRLLSKSYISNLLAGFIFTFSSYHFAHAQGHLNLISLEFIPLFILFFYRSLLKPNIIFSASAAIVLFAVLLCDYYYFFYACMIGFLFLVWFILRQRKQIFKQRRAYLLNLLTFLFLTIATSGQIIFRFIHLFKNDYGGHISTSFSLDLLSLFIPGGHWYFANLTKQYWSILPGNIQETSVFIPFSVIFMVIYAFRMRKIIKKNFGIFFIIPLVFLVLSLGPVLQINGVITGIPLPYGFFEFFPLISLSGVPIRMMAVVHLFLALLFAIGFKQLLMRKTIKSLIVIILVTVILVIQLLPSPLPLTKITIPRYVLFLRALPDSFGVLDASDTPLSLRLYYQIVHRKPLAYAYLSRVPYSASFQTARIFGAVRSKHVSSVFSTYHIRYLVVANNYKITKPVIYQDSTVRIYDLR